uniref:Uncharacterized protein n=1 Tax=Arundo donax TaxID=35708 RepID=A0A0A9AFT7_ARUDO
MLHHFWEVALWLFPKLLHFLAVVTVY